MNDVLLNARVKELINTIDRNTFKVLLTESFGGKNYENIDNDKLKDWHTDVTKLELYLKDVYAGYNLTENQRQFVFKSLIEYFNECIVKIKPSKNSYTLNLLNELLSYSKIELERETTAKVMNKEIEPIKLELNQTQIIYLFQVLIDQKLINESVNPKLWNLVSQYFCDSSGKSIGNIHQLKDKLKNSKTGKPKSKADEIEKIVNDIKKK